MPERLASSVKVGEYVQLDSHPCQVSQIHDPDSETGAYKYSGRYPFHKNSEIPRLYIDCSFVSATKTKHAVQGVDFKSRRLLDFYEGQATVLDEEMDYQITLAVRDQEGLSDLIRTSIEQGGSNARALSVSDGDNEVVVDAMVEE